MNGLDGREVRYFVAVAEELHFGLAAERLRVAQPAVLRTIAALERRLGAGLLDRSTRHVALTPAGEVLLGHARVALDALAAAERLTVRAARRPSELVVAVKPDGDGALLGPLVAVYEAEPGAPPARSLLVRLAELTACVRDGRADVALVPRPFDARGLRWEEVLREPRVEEADDQDQRLTELDRRADRHRAEEQQERRDGEDRRVGQEHAREQREPAAARRLRPDLRSSDRLHDMHCRTSAGSPLGRSRIVLDPAAVAHAKSGSH
jgi:DNA-binding transcriptional LysR family regulator